eukprot:g619.t1
MPKRNNRLWQQEASMLHRVSHPGVQTLVALYESEEYVYLVTELLLGPDLYDFIDSRLQTPEDSIDEKTALMLGGQMLSAAEAIHRAGLAHLDIKPENFVFRTASVDSPLVMVDFGSAEPFQLAPYAETTAEYQEGLDDELDEIKLNRLCGTAAYLSPEVAEGRFSSRSDVWSIGVVLYAILCGDVPFATPDERVDDATPFLAHVSFDQQRWQHVGDTCKQVVQWMLRPDPVARASTTECLDAINAC